MPYSEYEADRLVAQSKLRDRCARRAREIVETALKQDKNLLPLFGRRVQRLVGGPGISAGDWWFEEDFSSAGGKCSIYLKRGKMLGFRQPLPTSIVFDKDNRPIDDNQLDITGEPEKDRRGNLVKDIANALELYGLDVSIERGEGFVRLDIRLSDDEEARLVKGLPIDLKRFATSETSNGGSGQAGPNKNTPEHQPPSAELKKERLVRTVMVQLFGEEKGGSMNIALLSNIIEKDKVLDVFFTVWLKKIKKNALLRTEFEAFNSGTATKIQLISLAQDFIRQYSDRLKERLNKISKDTSDRPA